jgi:TonB family protein
MAAYPIDRRLAFSFVVSLVLHAVIVMTGGGGHSVRAIAPSFSVTFVQRKATVQLTPQHEVAVAQPADSPVPLLPGWAPVLPVDGHYYAADDVDVRAEFIQAAEVEYPARALFADVGGVVRVRVLINESGTVDVAEVLAATPPKVFDKAVVDALRQSRFSPARKFGRNVKSKKIIEFNLVAEDALP